MSGQWEYSLGIYKAGPEVPLLVRWLEWLVVLVLQETHRARLGAGGRETGEGGAGVKYRRGGGARYGFAVLAKSSAVRYRVKPICLNPSPCPEIRSKERVQ